MVETRAKAYPASAAMDVDAPVKGSTGTATEADNSAAVLSGKINFFKRGWGLMGYFGYRHQGWSFAIDEGSQEQGSPLCHKSCSWHCQL